MANQHPISYIKAHRALYREEYAEIMQRNVGQGEDSPQEEDDPHVGEAFEEPPDEEYQALIMEPQGAAAGEKEEAGAELAHRRGKKARKDLAGFQGEVDWTLSTELYRKWQRKLRKRSGEGQEEPLAASSDEEEEEQQEGDEEINEERVQMLGIILTGGMVSMERMHSTHYQ